MSAAATVARAPMSRLERRVNVAAVVVPFLGFVGALALLWNKAVGPRDLAILAGTYLVIGLGVTVGYHRLLTHRSFATHRWLSYLFAALGSMAVQGSVIDWVADHRKHHAHTDAEGDPHSPHVGDGSGLRGLWHAHVGWLFRSQGRAAKRRYAPDLLEDPGMRAISRAFLPLVVLSLAIPAALGWALAGTVAGGRTPQGPARDPDRLDAHHNGHARECGTRRFAASAMARRAGDQPSLNERLRAWTCWCRPRGLSRGRRVRGRLRCAARACGG